MHCERCEGLMVMKTITDMDGTTTRLQAWRCVICGNVTDPQIGEHPKMRQTAGARKALRHRPYRNYPQASNVG